jgi:hypothetical protein
MALYAKYDVRPSDENGDWGSEEDMAAVPPAKMDEMLREALEALEQTRRLHESSPNPEIKRQAKLIIDHLHSSLLKLAPLGIHSAGRLERMPAVS